MKHISNLLFFAAIAAATACSETGADSNGPRADAGNVRFVANIPQGTRGPVYTADDFRILVFEKSGSDFLFRQELMPAVLRTEGAKVTGTLQLPAGEYKFVPTCGFMNPGNYTWPSLSGAALTDALYVTHTGESFPEAFMLNSKLDAVPSYTVTLDGERQTVAATLHRAVSRVDVLFIRADKAGEAYTEKTGDDVFGPEKLASAKFVFTDANSRLGLSGEKVEGLFDPTYTLTTVTDALTMGTGTATTLATDGYDFDNVQPADIISGSAHLEGAYLIPNPDATATTGLELQLTSGEGTPRTITLPARIPVERNKATLVRVYVLGDNVFTTGVGFEVEVDTVWDGSNVVDTEID